MSQLRCVNEECPARLCAQIEHFAKVMGIKGLGYAIIKQLVDKGRINRYSDKYYFKGKRRNNVRSNN